MSFATQIELEPGIVYTAERLQELGFSRTAMRRLVEKDVLAALGTGVYVHDYIPEETDDLVVVATRCPPAVFNLLTAADFHDINEEQATAVSFAIPRSATPPVIGGGFNADLRPIRVARELDMVVGVDTANFRGVDVKITNIERTVCDLWRYSYLNPAVRGKPRRISDETLKSAVGSYLQKTDGAEGELMNMMSDLELPASMYQSFKQFIQSYSSGYNSGRVW